MPRKKGKPYSPLEKQVVQKPVPEINKHVVSCYYKTTAYLSAVNFGADKYPFYKLYRYRIAIDVYILLFCIVPVYCVNPIQIYSKVSTYHNLYEALVTKCHPPPRNSNFSYSIGREELPERHLTLSPYPIPGICKDSDYFQPCPVRNRPP